jgi:TonB family protein
VFNKFGVPASQAATVPAAAASSAAEVKTPFNAGLPSTHGSGAASAPAPARDVHDSHVAEISPARTPAEVEPRSDKPVEAAHSESSSYAGSAPSFTFGGANVPTESSGGSKKIFVGVAAAALVAAGLYVGWTKFQEHGSQPVSTQAPGTPAPVTVPQTAKPVSIKPTPTIPASAPATSASLPSSQPATEPAKTHAADDTNFASDDASGQSATKPSSSDAPAAGRTAAEAKPATAPLVVKGGTAPAIHSKTAAADGPAPSMIGIATAGAGAPPPDLVSAEGSAPKPILQTLNVSQGVSQGLLMKKVQPTYPKNALAMRVEGVVELSATISKTGDISHIKILSGDSQLTRAAAEAVKQWKYKPYLLNGEPVEIQTQVTINFKLPK